ncbi:MAG: glycosyltransferase family 1 protein, partial [Cyanobacteria bacterium P01_F01_bin.42]
AMACGCQVFSSVNHGLSDYLDPGFNCHKIAGYSTTFDVQRILNTVNSYGPPRAVERILDEYRAENIDQRLSQILAELNLFFDHQQMLPSDIPVLDSSRLTRLKFERLLNKVKAKLAR